VQEESYLIILLFLFNMIKKYRKKPVVIQAEQFVKSGHWPKEVYPDLSSKTGFSVDTLEGKHEVTDGDYIITGIAGEKYPCKPHIFNKTYEEVQE